MNKTDENAYLRLIQRKFYFMVNKSSEELRLKKINSFVSCSFAFSGMD